MVQFEHVHRQPSYLHAEQEASVFVSVFVFVFMFVLVLKRIGERFLDLDIPSVLVAAMDVTNETPPPELPITFAALPTILLLTADDKGPPYRYEGTRYCSPGKKNRRLSNVTVIYSIRAMVFLTRVICASKHCLPDIRCWRR